MPLNFTRSWSDEDLDRWRDTVVRFVEDELAPQDEQARANGHVGHALWRRAGELGLLCCTMPTEFGGSGVDRLYSVILMEEQARVGDSASGFSLHSDIVANYIVNFGTPAQKNHWLPKMASGDAVTAIAMTPIAVPAITVTAIVVTPVAGAPNNHRPPSPP